MTIARDEYARRMRMVDRAFVALTILFFAILISFMILLLNVRHVSHKAVILAKENKILLQENDKRIAQDKIDGVASCKHTYSGIKDVFEIFYPKPPRTTHEKRDIKKFNDRIVELQLACEKQADK